MLELHKHRKVYQGLSIAFQSGAVMRYYNGLALLSIAVYYSYTKFNVDKGIN